MSYAAPFYYAAKAIQTDERPQHTRRRRRRIRLVLFPAQRPQARQQARPATASGDC
jgi:hypothetical protein